MTRSSFSNHNWKSDSYEFFIYWECLMPIANNAYFLCRKRLQYLNRNVQINPLLDSYKEEHHKGNPFHGISGMETYLFNDKKRHFGWLLIFTLYYFTLSIRLCCVDLILIYRLSDYSLCKVLKWLMQMLNSLLGGCSNSRSDCSALARDGHCHSNPYATLRECPIACAVPCGKCFTI